MDRSRLGGKDTLRPGPWKYQFTRVNSIAFPRSKTSSVLSTVKSVQADLQAAYKFEPADISVENYPIPEAGNDDPRQQFAPFQICLPCKCCAAASPAPTCTTMPCCFGIDCQIPKKPFGFCAFVPKTCNCTSCAV
ncbi:hypothetical protein CRG98_034945 [Punica granatum]|uniref:DUF7866 domain-containing protein n=1 Tax=Punica granatum TaxID=22663 RepID=A0A2I0ILN8_PUNGR|nr:hypothetical protein CRG98_034945 [Punica granatum]